MKDYELIVNKIRVSDKNFKIRNFETQLGIDQFPDKTVLENKLKAEIEEIADLQNILYAENRRSLLIIFQGMDSAGKDGAIKHIMKGINPQGISVYSFKHPSDQDLDHDYLWRHSIKLPEHGKIVIFNRSYYENVLISKVHPKLVLAERIRDYDKLSKIDKNFWKLRYNQINQFEKTITETGTQILKFFLHISEQEQSKRFLERINNPDKHWKFSSDDIEERQYWSDYQDVYEQTIKHTSTKQNPWYVIPADDKINTHFLISNIILEKMRQMRPTFPTKTKEEQAYMNKAKLVLESECGNY
jgi:PPK2 family polyphosphate:nucleotide phosphotransferase